MKVLRGGWLVVVALSLLMTNWGGEQAVHAAESLCVRPGGDEDCFARIQDAVNAAESGDTIVVKKGTYVEQVTVVGKNLTLDAEDAATLRAPTTMEQNLLPELPDRAIIGVKNAEVTVRDFVVDGAKSGETNQRLSGIVFVNAGGTIKKNTVKDIAFAQGLFFDPEVGYEGDGILVVNLEATERVVTVTQNRVVGFNNNGITLASDFDSENSTDIFLNATVTKNRVVGGGATDVLDQYGISLFRVRGVVRDNRVSDLNNTTFGPESPLGPAIGIFTEHADSSLFEKNTITNTQLGITAFLATTSEFKRNKIRGPEDGLGFVGLELTGDGNRVERNTFTGYDVGIYLYNNPDFGTATNTTLEDNRFRDVTTPLVVEEGASLQAAPAAQQTAPARKGR